jgi:hypothetical protein
MLGGVGGDAHDVGDVGEYDGDGVSGVVGEYRFGGEGYRCLYDGNGLDSYSMGLRRGWQWVGPSTTSSMAGCR